MKKTVNNTVEIVLHILQKRKKLSNEQSNGWIGMSTSFLVLGSVTNSVIQIITLRKPIFGDLGKC